MKNKELLKITTKLKITSQKVEFSNINNFKNTLKLIKRKLLKNKKIIIRSINKDVKKPLISCEAEFNNSIKIWNYVINNVGLIKKEKKFIFKNNKKGIVNYTPIGLVGLITPWNYPLLTLSERLSFCLGAGCSAIIKPSENTPTFAKILKKIINSDNRLDKRLKITSDIKPKTGEMMCMDPNIDLISFVGSTNTGKKISQQCANSLKKTNLELGGKNSAIICKSSKIDFAINKVIEGIFENGGQACVSISRVLIDEKIYEIFIKKIVLKVTNLIKMNKLIIQTPANKKQRKKVISLIKYIKNSLNKKSIKVFDHNSAKQYSPIFIFSKNKKDFFLNDEFFFPVVSFGKFKNIDECIKMNNSTSYGLGSYIFSSDNNDKKQLIANLQCGRIWINTALEWDPALPVGGFNMSGKGRDMGIDGFLIYLTTKSVYIKNDI